MDSSIAIGKDLFILYLVISNNFLSELLNCKVQHTLKHNMVFKHLLGFLTLYFFITLISRSETHPSNISYRIGFTLIIYLFFIISTRIAFRFWIPFIVSIGIVYIIDLFKQEEKKKNEHKRNNRLIVLFNKVQKGLIGLASLLMLIGFITYIGEKKSEYRTQFQWKTFFFGKSICKRDEDSSKLSTGEAISRAFTN
jgi:hypothetical protein